MRKMIVIIMFLLLITSVNAFIPEDFLSVNKFNRSGVLSMDFVCAGNNPPTDFLVGMESEKVGGQNVYKYCASVFNLTNPTGKSIHLKSVPFKEGFIDKIIRESKVLLDGWFSSLQEDTMLPNYEKVNRYVVPDDLILYKLDSRSIRHQVNDSLSYETVEFFWNKEGVNNINIPKDDYETFMLVGLKPPESSVKWALSLYIDGIDYYLDPFWNGTVGELSLASLVKNDEYFCDAFDNSSSSCSHFYENQFDSYRNFEKDTTWALGGDARIQPFKSADFLIEGAFSMKFVMNTSWNPAEYGTWINYSAPKDISRITSVNSGCTGIRGNYSFRIFIDDWNKTKNLGSCGGGAGSFMGIELGTSTSNTMKDFIPSAGIHQGLNYINRKLNSTSCIGSPNWKKLNYTYICIGNNISESVGQENISVYIDDLRFFNNSNEFNNELNKQSGVWQVENESGNYVLGVVDSTWDSWGVINLSKTLKPINSTMYLKVQKRYFLQGHAGIKFNMSQPDEYCTYGIAADGTWFYDGLGNSYSNATVLSTLNDYYWLKAVINNTHLKGYVSSDGINYMYVVNGTFTPECNGNVGITYKTYHGGYDFYNKWYFDNFLIQKHISPAQNTDSVGSINSSQNITATYLYSEFDNKKEGNVTISWFINNVWFANYTTINPSYFNINNTLIHSLFHIGDVITANITSCAKKVTSKGCNTTNTQSVSIPDFSIINTTFFSNVNETSNASFSMELNYNAVGAKLSWNGTLFNMTKQKSNSSYTLFNKTITIPLQESNVSVPIIFNYSSSAGNVWYVTPSETQNIKIVYIVNFNTASVPSSLVEEEKINPSYTVTRFLFSTAQINFYRLAFYNETFNAEVGQPINMYTTTYYKNLTTRPVANLNGETVNVAGIINVSFRGRSFIRTSNASRTVNPFILFNCTSTKNTTTMNITIRDENSNLASLNFLKTTFKLINRQWSFNLFNQSSYKLCLKPNVTRQVDATMQYGSIGQSSGQTSTTTATYPLITSNSSIPQVGTTQTSYFNPATNVTTTNTTTTTYDTSSTTPSYSVTTTTTTVSTPSNTQIYYLKNVSLTWNNIYYLTLYLLNSTDTQIIQFHVVDEDGYDLKNVYISVQKYNPSTGNYITVSSLKTDEKGRTSGNLVLYKEIYRFILTFEGRTVLVTEPAILNSNIYEWQVTAGADVLKRFTDLMDIKFYLSYNNATGNARCIISDTSAETISACMDTVKRTSRGDTLMSHNCESSTSMTLLYNVGINVSNTYIISCYVNYDLEGKTTKYLLDTITISPQTAEMFEKMGMTGMFFGGFILLGTLMFGGLSYGISGAAVIMGIGVIILKVLGLLGWGYTTVILILCIGVAVIMRSRT